MVPASRLDLAGQALLADTGLRWRAEVSTPGMLGLSLEHGRVAVLDEASDHPQRLLLELHGIRRHRYPPRYLLVLGAPALRERLETIAAELEARGTWLHCADGISAWENRQPRWGEQRVAKSLRAAAAAAFSRRHWSEGEAETQHRRIELDRVLTQAGARDLELYRRLLAARPRATLALLAAIAVVFGLQAAWGGVDLPPLLTRMGSMVPERALGGQWWRFVACTFLHGGTLHVALNSIVLWMLGRSLEPIIGVPRFLFIYFASGLAGSLASSLFVTSQSVGASGAIWGLLGAHAALAFYPRPLLPSALIGLARRTAATNLALNLVNSFNPHVDAAAHVGGGLMGALILVSMALSGGLSSHGRPSPPAGAWLRGVAAALALTFGLGFARGIVAGRPWELDRPPELSKVDLPDSPWRVGLPSGQTTRSASAGGTWLEFGDLSHDPTLVDIGWEPLSDGPSDREPRDELALILRRLATAPEGLEPLSAPRLVRDDARPARSFVAVRYRYVSNDEWVDDRAIGIIDGARVRVRVIAWAALPRAYEGLSARILRSIEPAATSRAWLGEPRGVFHSGVSSPPQVGEGVKVRVGWSLLAFRGEPFPGLGTMMAPRLLEEVCLGQPRASRAVPLLAQRVQ